MAEFRTRASAAAAPRGAARERARVERGLWHRPALLHLISDLLMLFAAVAFGWALVAWFVSRPLFPLREVILLSPAEEVTEAQLEYVARTAIRGNFFTVDLEAVREAFESVPWVRRAEVRRRWPDGIELRLVEQRAVASWKPVEGGEPRLVNSDGELFAATTTDPMPALAGPQGTSQRLLARYQQLGAMLQPLNLHVVGVSLSAREAWQLTTDNGMVILLGRESEQGVLDRRLKRFIAAWPQLQQHVGTTVAVADLRYPGGFALTPADGVIAGKGKQ
ncbi:cell division protein FtsQ/DivIB [Azoarcus olearius]|uniref:Cell division protein FtsQ n=1 Tax=Azoarcus sp. (strain BH72) TaxID=418699 RepID=A1K3U9_AZOSB|nr:cell division protein FtsQ/DivIB [Azoarcus olearius]CAL93504.1 putative cell division protein FtsQ [Azoarcus olearius]